MKQSITQTKGHTMNEEMKKYNSLHDQFKINGQKMTEIIERNDHAKYGIFHDTNKMSTEDKNELTRLQDDQARILKDLEDFC